MKKKLLALLLACAALFTAGCGSLNADSPHWMDSSIKGNVTADTVVSLKDDFAAAVNQDFYSSGESDGRTIINIARMVTDRKRALLTDEAVTGKGIDEVRKFVALAEDHEGRKALGVTPLDPYIRSIEAISSAEELYAWIANPDANPLGASPSDPGIHFHNDPYSAKRRQESNTMIPAGAACMLLFDHRQWAAWRKLKQDAFRQ